MQPNIDGQWKKTLLKKVAINGSWRLVREEWININGQWKKTPYYPIDRIDFPVYDLSESLIYWYYGKNWRSYPPFIFPEAINKITKLCVSVGIASGTGLNVPHEIYTSPIESLNPADYVATGIRYTPIDYGALTITQDVSERTIKMWVPRPDYYVPGDNSGYWDISNIWIVL